jgi:hypothetical protein
MDYYLNIEKKIFKSIRNSITDQRGEFQIYDNNIRQKSNNSVNLKFVFNKNDINFSNFGYSREGTIFAYIYLEKYLILYDFTSLRTLEIFELPNEIKSNIYEYIFLEKRNFVMKIFTRLSFLELNEMTNNIYLNEKATFIVISSCNKIENKF